MRLYSLHSVDYEADSYNFLWARKKGYCLVYLPEYGYCTFNGDLILLGVYNLIYLHDL